MRGRFTHRGVSEQQRGGGGGVPPPVKLPSPPRPSPRRPRRPPFI